ILFTKAINQSDVSLAIPLMNISPILLLLTSFIILGELPTTFGLIGILLIVIGAYTLNIKQRKEGFWQPFKELVKHNGAKHMLTAIFLWAITANFDKIGIRGSSPLFWSWALIVYISLGLTIVMIIKSKNFMQDIKSNFKILIPMGLMNGISSVCHMTAISLTLVSYVISIKRTSSIMVVIMGALLFKEKGLKERLWAVIIMVLGVVMISLG
ncbi:MAG: EamA family transporter, partial [Nanoarchaeota archaeon]|nr:EamA family transporter [Nanoarchaeota archaeon]